jgi:hypothetical protein
MTNEERNNILDQHKEVYDGYVTQYAQSNEQPLYTQDFANDKEGLTVNNKGVVTTYKNMNINEMKHDGKSTGLFSDEEEEYNEGYISAGTEYAPEESFEEVEEQLDMIGDGEDDLTNGTVDFDDDFGFATHDGSFDGDDSEDDDFEMNLDDLMDLGDEENEIEEEEKEEILNKINESLDMFKRLKKYN